MDIVCFSHLRWNFVFQRPQHLLSRFASTHRVYYVEEPTFDAEKTLNDIELTAENVAVITPRIVGRPNVEDTISIQKSLLTALFVQLNIQSNLFWYYTPMALEFTRDLHPDMIVYDCMDELSAFKFAPPLLRTLEQELMSKADIVFTGGQSLYEAKKHQHHNIYPFPSSIDKMHFAQARRHETDPQDQVKIGFPRLGFFGVIDERFDIDLIREVATAQPDWQIVLIGPVVKIDPATLPRNPNIHYLGAKTYAELPSYLGGWQIALIPFAINESTKFISPTKTPEYLSAGKPVISTAITDVISPYGESGLVHIIHNATEFIRAANLELGKTNRALWLEQVDNFLAGNSWNSTFNSMHYLITETGKDKFSNHKKEKNYV